MGLKTFLNNVRGLGRVKLFNQEQRSGYPYSFLDPLINNLASIGLLNGDGADPVITPQTAARISTVFTCVLVRSESLSSLPVNVMRSTSSGSHVAYNNPVQYLIHNKPNPYQTASDFWKTVSAHIDLHGNAYGFITYSGRIQPTRIDLAQYPWDVTIQKTPEGDVLYLYKGKQYRSWEVLHFKDLSLDCYYGCSKISYNAETLGYAAKLKNYGKQAIGTKPPGYFTTTQPYDTIKRQQEDLSKQWKEKIAQGMTPFLPMGLEYKGLLINPGDAQYLDAVNATKEDIYGIFRVPPTLAQNYERATFSNAEQQDLVFIKYTMLPLITNIEQECNAKLFAEANKTAAEPYYVKFNVNAFMRGDFKSRTEGYKSLWERGLISGNQVADLEDWNHYEGGDRRFVPMNMIPLDRVDEFVDNLSKPEPASTDTGEQESQRKVKINGRSIDHLLNGFNGYDH
jgi:HK97 family phage portal protein